MAPSIFGRRKKRREGDILEELENLSEGLRDIDAILADAGERLNVLAESMRDLRSSLEDIAEKEVIASRRVSPSSWSGSVS